MGKLKIKKKNFSGSLYQLNCQVLPREERRLLNPLSARAFFGLFLKKYRKFEFVTQFLRNGSTKIQSFVYHFVANFILFLKIRERFS